jgi:cyclophilin family peptidyl-prolyl cis-trans isomerase
MMTRALAALLLALGLLAAPHLEAQAPPGGSPQMTIETEKGPIQIRLFQAEAPRSIEHIMALVKRNFYRQQRFHRVEASLVQFGDPTSRDMSQRSWWGRRGSGRAIGVAELGKRLHTRGAVSLAHSGDARFADSQIFILKAASPSLNGKHVVIGQVTSGMAVVDAIRVADVIKQITITEAGRKE